MWVIACGLYAIMIGYSTSRRGLESASAIQFSNIVLAFPVPEKVENSVYWA
jgi:hypothetical protein